MLDGVEAEPDLRRLAGRLGEGLRLEPSLGEVGEGDLAGVRVDVGAAQHVGGDGGEEPFGVPLAVEVFGPLVAVGIVIAGLPPLALAVAGRSGPARRRLFSHRSWMCAIGAPLVVAARRSSEARRSIREASRAADGGWGSYQASPAIPTQVR